MAIASGILACLPDRGALDSEELSQRVSSRLPLEGIGYQNQLPGLGQANTSAAVAQLLAAIETNWSSL
jgi:hypothetical protein